MANPAHVAHGDFALESDGHLTDSGPARLTYSGVGVYRAALFDDWRTALHGHAGAAETPARFPLAPLLRAAMRQHQVSGEFFAGDWVDVGTPQRLAELDRRLRNP